MTYKLVSPEGDLTFEIKPGAPQVIGRAMTSDIPVFDPTISRRHAEITLEGAQVLVRDLGSSNGTFVNGNRVTEFRLAPGDFVTFGKVRFQLKDIAPPPPAGAPGAPGKATSVAADAGNPPPGATIVRQVAVRDSNGMLAQALRTSDPEKKQPDTSADGKQAERLKTLLQVSTYFNAAKSVDALLEKIAESCFKVFDVDRVSILLGDSSEQLAPRVAIDKKGRPLTESVPRSIAHTAFKDMVAIQSDNAAEDSRFGGQSILMQQVRSAICVPLVGSENRALGVLYVDSQAFTHRFGEDDLDFLVAFSGIAAVAIENSQFSERIRQESLIRSNFERYFSPNLAAQIAQNQDATRLRGDKRPVAVLFSDIRGFTALSETMNPDDMANLLTEYFTEMVECVFKHNGTLDKFIGDAVMAQWGAPIATADDADKAMAAAIEMILELDKLNMQWSAAGRPQLQIGIGLNYGEAFAGNIGSERRLEFTVIGDTVNTASRLCGAADGRQILISDDFRKALKDPPRVQERPPMELKGKSQAVPVYSVVL
jgi:adenylate cyclase